MSFKGKNVLIVGLIDTILRRPFGRRLNAMSHNCLILSAAIAAATIYLEVLFGSEGADVIFLFFLSSHCSN